jgi:SAM-dependent methyltransferase
MDSINSSEDKWFDSFKEKSKKEKKPGLYRKLARLRWVIAIDHILDGLPEGSRILKTDGWNEASGRGLVNHLLGKHKVTIYDISPGIIEKVKSVVTDCLVGDIQDLAFDCLSFDAVLDISTSDHCPQDALPNIISQYHKALKENGRLLLIHNSNKSIIWKICRAFGIQSPAYTGFPPAYYFDPEYVLSLLTDLFEIIEIRCTSLLGWASGLLDKLPINDVETIKKIASIELKINHRVISRLGRQYLFFCRKKR